MKRILRPMLARNSEDSHRGDCNKICVIAYH